MWTEVTLQDKVLKENRHLIIFLFLKVRESFFFLPLRVFSLLLRDWAFWNVTVSIFSLWFSCLINKGLLYFSPFRTVNVLDLFLMFTWSFQLQPPTADFLNLALGWSGAECICLDKSTTVSFCYFHLSVHPTHKMANFPQGTLPTQHIRVSNDFLALVWHKNEIEESTTET